MEEVGNDQPARAQLAVRNELRTPGKHKKAAAEQHHAHRKLPADRGVSTAHLDPHQADDRSQQYDEQRVDILQPAGGDLEPPYHAVRMFFREQVHRGTGLLESGPEKRGPDEEQHDQEHMLLFCRRMTGKGYRVNEVDQRECCQNHADRGDKLNQREGKDPRYVQPVDGRSDGSQSNQTTDQGFLRLTCFLGCLVGNITDTGKVLLTMNILDDRCGHAHTSGTEAEMPADVLTQIRTNGRPEDRTDVDAHVENREACVPSGTALGIEIADDRGDVRFEETGADGDQRQTDEVGRQGRDRQHVVPEGDNDAAPQHGIFLADQPIGKPAARQRQYVNTKGVETVDRRSVLRAPGHTAAGCIGHKQNEQRTHPVVREALPHLCKEERGKATRMAEKLLLTGRIQLTHIDSRVIHLWVERLFTPGPLSASTGSCFWSARFDHDFPLFWRHRLDRQTRSLACDQHFFQPRQLFDPCQ